MDEDPEGTVLRRLGELELDELLELHEELRLTEIPIAKKDNISYVRKTIIRFLSSDDILNAEDDGLSEFLRIRTFMETFDKKVDAADDKSKVKDKPSQKELVTEKTDADVKSGAKLEKPVKSASKSVGEELVRNLSAWKKDFKITGSIGQPGQKEKLSFSSLAFQIENADKKGYGEVEICEAVVKAVSCDLPLRSYLEGKVDLDLPTLRRILRTHFQEKDASTLFSQLSHASQTEKETPMEFVVRLMNLRQKVLFTSKEGDKKFSESLVQDQFLHSVVTGLRNDTIKNEIKPAVKALDLKDEELLELVNKTVSDEQERQAKIKKAAGVNVIENGERKVKKEERETWLKENSTNSILAELKEMRVQLSEVASLKNDVEKLKQLQNNVATNTNTAASGGYRRRARFGCAQCQQNNVSRCTHCFRCGSTDHVRAQCPKKLLMVTPEGHKVTNEKIEPQSSCDNVGRKCVGCLKHKTQMFRCSKCHSGLYCSRDCQKNHWDGHKDLCVTICQLDSHLKESSQMNESHNKEGFVNAVFSSRSRLTPKEEMKLVKMVGQRCTVDCLLDGVPSEALWDTGAEVALVGQKWLQENLPKSEIHEVSRLLGQELVLKVANNAELKYGGYVEVVFQMSETSEPLLVPFLVTEEEIASPIVGFNVIEEVVKCQKGKDKPEIEQLLEGSLKSIEKKDIAGIVNLIQSKESDKEAEVLGSVVIGRKDVVVPKGRSLKVKCISNCGPIAVDTPVLFQPNCNLDLDSNLVVGEGIMLARGGKSKFVVPVSNPGGCDVVLKANTQVGIITSVASVLPCPVFDAEINSVPEENQGKVKIDGEELLGDEVEEWLKKVDLDHLPVDQQKRVREMLRKHSSVFSKSSSDIGEIKDLKMKINLHDKEPVKRSYTSIPKPLYKEVKEYIEDLVAQGWVKKSYSSYSSPLVCVRKKDGSLRLCVDYRKLNSKTIPDSQPIPKVQDILNSLGGNSWFTTLDMSKAYHQGYVDEESRPLTAFATPWSLLEWCRIPFGLMNAPPVFQRYMNECLAGLRDVICIPYLDDILVYSRSFESHLDGVDMVLKRLGEHGIKLNPGKCNWFKKEAKYLGHMLSKDGYRVDGASKEIIDKLRVPPKTVGEVRSLLGFIGYYRSFIKDFSRKAKVLYDLLCKEKVAEGKSKPKSQQRPSSDKVVWSEQHQCVLNELLEYLKEPPVMAYPDFSLPFILHCDASELGLGAVLYQEQDGKVRVVSYGSRTLTPSEKNYYLHSGKLEFLAMKWAITEKFHDLLYYAPSFTVFTDCNPLSYLLTSAKLNATTIRWVGELANYNFNIKYRPGKQSIDCDFLSRYPCDIDMRMKQCTEEVGSESIGAIVSGCKEKGKFARVNMIAVPEPEQVSITQINPGDIQDAQRSDPVIRVILPFVENHNYPEKAVRKQMNKKERLMLNQLKKLELNGNGVLVRKTNHHVQVVLPEKYKSMVYEELHEKMGHLSAERVVQLCQERVYWPYMSQDIHHYVERVCQCLKSKKPNRQQRAPLVNITTSEPFEIVSVDFLHLDKSKGGCEYLLVLVDHFTRFVQVYPTRNNKGRTAADKIFNEFVLRFGFPKRLHHDQGMEFENHLFKRLHELSGVEASRTTPYHPQGDGQVERMNRTIINMLKTLPELFKSNWKDHVNKLVFAYNCTKNNATTFSPFHLLYGRSPRLPIDFMFGLHKEPERGSYADYVNSWKKAMLEAYAVAGRRANKNSVGGKKNYDKKLFGACLKVGDRVLVRNLSKRGGTGKLRSYWEEHVHVVVAKKNDDIPVYTVKPECGKGKERVLHRNLLLPCDHLPLETPELLKDETQKPPMRKKTERRGQKKQQVSRKEKEKDQQVHVQEEETDSEEELLERFVANLPEVESEYQDSVDSEEGQSSRMASTNSSNESSAFDDKPVLVEQVSSEESGSETGEFKDASDLNTDDSSGDIEGSVNSNESEESDNGSDLSSGNESSSSSSGSISNAREERSRRARKPRKILTYDELGNPVFREILPK